MELTRIYYNYANETYSTENKTVGNHDNIIAFDFVLTIQRQELAELVDEGYIDWKTAFKLEGDFVAWNELCDDLEEVED